MRNVMVIQQGARRNYVYARQLEDAGLLHSLVCDTAWPDGRKSIAVGLVERLMPSTRVAVHRRRVVGVPAERVRPTVLPNFGRLLGTVLDRERTFAAVDEILAARCKHHGSAGVDAIVNYLGNGGSFLDWARQRGVAIATDFIITPCQIEIEQAERERWPGWEAGYASRSMIDFFRRRMSHLVAISDIYLCPSETVARDLATLDGFDPSRVRLVPYGISGVLVRPAVPNPGRVLFAGAAGLRKGVPYLAAAAHILKERAPHIEIVVAGAVTDIVRNRWETQALTFLGKLGLEAMADEMAKADVFCLPSLAEGSATSVFEAMANGLPTVTTASSGTVVADGEDGLIIPERDPAALAGAIEKIVADRNLRARMSAVARATAAKYNDEACGARFITVIEELLASRAAKGECKSSQMITA